MFQKNEGLLELVKIMSRRLNYEPDRVIIALGNKHAYLFLSPSFELWRETDFSSFFFTTFCWDSVELAEIIIMFWNNASCFQLQRKQREKRQRKGEKRKRKEGKLRPDSQHWSSSLESHQWTGKLIFIKRNFNI